MFCQGQQNAQVSARSPGCRYRVEHGEGEASERASRQAGRQAGRAMGQRSITYLPRRGRAPRTPVLLALPQPLPVHGLSRREAPGDAQLDAGPGGRDGPHDAGGGGGLLRVAAEGEALADAAEEGAAGVPFHRRHLRAAHGRGVPRLPGRVGDARDRWSGGRLACQRLRYGSRGMHPFLFPAPFFFPAFFFFPFFSTFLFRRRVGVPYLSPPGRAFVRGAVWRVGLGVARLRDVKLPEALQGSFVR